MQLVSIIKSKKMLNGLALVGHCWDMCLMETYSQTGQLLTNNWFDPSFRVSITAAAVAGLVNRSGICRLCKRKPQSPRCF